MDPQKIPSSSGSNEDKTIPVASGEPKGVPPFHQNQLKDETTPVEASGTPANEPDGDSDKSEARSSLASAAQVTPESSDESTESTSSAPAEDVNAANTAPQAPPAQATPDAEAADPVSPDQSVETSGSAASASPVAAPRSSRKKMMILSLLVAVFVLLLGGAAAAYYVVLNKPENVLKTALANSLSKDKVKTVHFSGEFDASEGKNNPSLGATFNGASAQSGAFDLTAKVDAYVTNLTVDMRSVNGKSVYVRVGGLEGLPELMAGMGGGAEAMQVYAPMIAAINNQWFEINESLIKQFTGAKDTTFSDADLQKLKDAYQKHSFLVVKESLAAEKIKGVNSYHYKVVVNPTELKAFVSAVKDANLSSMKITKEQVESFNKSLKEVKFDKYPVDVWISKSDKFINQISFKFSEDGATGTFRFTVDSFNKPVTVEKPEGAKSILEVLGAFLGGSGAGGGTSLNSSTLLQGMESDSGISL